MEIRYRCPQAFAYELIMEGYLTLVGAYYMVANRVQSSLLYFILRSHFHLHVSGSRVLLVARVRRLLVVGGLL